METVTIEVYAYRRAEDRNKHFNNGKMVSVVSSFEKFTEAVQRQLNSTDGYNYLAYRSDNGWVSLQMARKLLSTSSGT